MDPSTHKINTQRLRPLCQRTSRTVMSILENGDISMEILAKPQSGNQEASQAVHEMVHISGDGTKVQLYQNNQGTGGGDRQGGQSCWTHQEFVYPDLPPKQLKKYVHVYRFVELVKSRTPKIVLTTDRAKCKLMENSPSPDFQADFHDGMSIQISKRKVHVTDSDGNSATSELGTVSQTFPDNVLERYHYSKQCESECLRLVDSFNSLKTNGECPLLYPISIGTTTSPVLIPLAQQTSSSDHAASSCSSPAVFCGDRTAHMSETCHSSSEATGLSPELPYHSSALSSVPAQCVDLQPNVETLCSHVSSAPCVQQQFYSSSHVRRPSTTNAHEHVSVHAHPHTVHSSSEFYLPSKYSQSNLLINDNGANIPNTTSDVPQECQNSLGKQDGGECQSSGWSECADTSCLPEFPLQQRNNCAHVSQGQIVSEGYNKFKYFSTMSDYHENARGESESQQELTPEEFFPEHLDMSGLRVTGHEIPYQCQPTDLKPLDTAVFTSKQPTSTQPGYGGTHTTPQSFQSSSDNISIHSQTFSSFSSSSDKRNVVVPSPSNNSSGLVENFSPQNTSGIVDTSENMFCFTPIQSSSVVTSYPDSNPSQSLQKMQRKGLSLDLSTALENQMKSLDLNTSRSDSMNPGTPQSAGSEKYMYSTQSALLKNIPRNISLNSTFSTCNINDRLRARQDQLNSSLPLSYDSRQYGFSTIPSTPQKQFLKTSDLSGDQGNSEFALPPQVRNSLDLSTSSNYSDSPSSSQSSSCEPLYQVFVPYTGWASYYASGAMWVLYNDGTQLGVKANEKTMTFIDQDGSQRKYNNKDVVPDIIKMKLEKFPSILNAVLNHQR